MTYDPRFRRTKIVATLGPATSGRGVLRRLLEAGVDVVRVNSSHGEPEERIALMRLVDEVRSALDRHVGILVDLQGPKIRVGVLDEPRELADGDAIEFAPEADARGPQLPTTYEALADDVEPGTRILLDDGIMAVEVTQVRGRTVRARVIHGGTLKSNKGMNLPGVRVSAPTLTKKDREDLELALEHCADFIGVSFVRRAEDVMEVRALIPAEVRLVAKIEKAAALEDLERIVEATDVLMVARGDLGVELPFEEVPLTQKRLIEVGNRGARAVITATQMLESMVRHPRPTRAEASDVANAILDGTDAVMLSAETAVGEYPVEAVNAMARIIHEIERSVLAEPRRRQRADDLDGGKPGTADDAIARATGVAAEILQVPLIVCFTKSGFTARKIAAFRPRTPILGLSTEPSTCRQLSVVWGVLPALADRAPSYDAMLDVAREWLVQRQYVKPGDQIAVTAGVPFEVPGTTNLLKIETV